MPKSLYDLACSSFYSKHLWYLKLIFQNMSIYYIMFKTPRWVLSVNTHHVDTILCICMYQDTQVKRRPMSLWLWISKAELGDLFLFFSGHFVCLTILGCDSRLCIVYVDSVFWSCKRCFVTDLDIYYINKPEFRIIQSSLNSWEIRGHDNHPYLNTILILFYYHPYPNTILILLYYHPYLNIILILSYYHHY